MVGCLVLGVIPLPVQWDHGNRLQLSAAAQVLTIRAESDGEEAKGRVRKASPGTKGVTREPFVTSAATDRVKQPYRPDELLIRLRPGIDAKKEVALHARAGVVVARRNEALGLIKVKLLPETDFGTIRDWYRRQADVELAVPNYLFRIANLPPASLVWADGDPGASSQWHLNQIRVPEAWDRLDQGAELTEVKVAVVDSGVDDNHQDLAGVVLPGRDFVNNDAYPMDDNGHGTHVAGIIAAVADNGVGIRGVAPNVRLLPVKVLASDGIGALDDIIAGMNYAIEQGARIINLSLGYAPGTALERADLRAAFEPVMESARQNGVLVVAAAGNDGWDEVGYPAALPHVMAVGAADQYDQAADFSNYGEALDLMAPGVSIYSTLPDNQYQDMTGTSMAAPMVTGTAALVWGAYPGLNSDHVETLVEMTARDLGPDGWDEEHGYGRLDVLASLEAQLPEPGESDDDPGAARPLPVGETAEGTLFPAGDVDWYRVEVDQGGPLYIEIDSPPAMDGVVEVFSAANLEAPLATVDYWGSGVADVGMVDLAAGTYYLKVSEFTARWDTAPYHLAVYQQPAADRWESNDSQATAPVIAVGGRAYGAIWPDGDADWFRLEVVEGSPVSLAVSPPPPVDLVLELYDASGSQALDTGGQPIISDNGFWGEPETITFTPRTKPYYVRVVDYTTLDTPGGDYRLGFSRRPYLLELAPQTGLLTDIDADGQTGLADLALAANSYGAAAGQPGWNDWTDLTGNQRVELHDLVIVARALRP